MPTATTPESLCPMCRFVKIIENRRGSRFFLCTLSATDPRFAKYPLQPVRSCSGFQPASTKNGNAEPDMPA